MHLLILLRSSDVVSTRCCVCRMFFGPFWPIQILFIYTRLCWYTRFIEVFIRMLIRIVHIFVRIIIYFDALNFCFRSLKGPTKRIKYILAEAQKLLL